MPDQFQPPYHIFLELDFHKLEFYVKLKFQELEFQNNDKLQNISQTMIDCDVEENRRYSQNKLTVYGNGVR